VVSLRELVGAGLTPKVARRLARTGVLHERHPGVFIVGHLALCRFAEEWAALLACGEGAVISHRSALALWGLGDRPRGVDVTVPRWCRPKKGVRMHRTTVEPRDLRTRNRLPTVSPARAVIDISADAGDHELEAVIAEGRAQHLIRDGELEKALDGAGARPGTGRLRALLRAEGDPGITRSGGERLLRRYLRAAQLPQPLTNRKIGKWEVDFLWPSERLVVELDGYPFHRDRRAFERDRRKDIELRDAGYTVIRITGSQLKTEPLMVIAHIARALDRAIRSHG
jgi:very-short-patch-repair endonuclease